MEDKEKATTPSPKAEIAGSILAESVKTFPLRDSITHAKTPAPPRSYEGRQVRERIHTAGTRKKAIQKRKERQERNSKIRMKQLAKVSKTTHGKKSLRPNRGISRKMNLQGVLASGR